MNSSTAVPQAMVAFAVLTANWEEYGVSYTHNFLPLIAHCLSVGRSDVVSETQVQSLMSLEFGILLPRHVIKTILRRAAKEDLVTRSNNVYRIHTKRIASYDLGSKRADASRAIQALSDSFIEFLRQEFNLEPSPLEAETALLNYVADRGIPILRASIRGESFQPVVLSEDQYEYAIGQFVAHLFERDPENFRSLEIAVKGSMLASAMYLPNPGTQSRRIRDLTVFLDTPFLIGLLGYSGQAPKEAATELLDLIARLGGRLSVYDHTLTETKNVMTSSAGQLRFLSRKTASLNAYPPLVEYCIQNGISSTELDVRSERLAEEFKDLGIAVEETPELMAELSVDEVRLEDTLQRIVGYRFEGARLNDVPSLTAIYRARRGTDRRELETAKAIFTTPNTSVVRASREFFGESPRGDQVPICALDHELGTIAWLKQPLFAPDLPRKQLIADCYANSFPGEQLWGRYLEQIEHLDAQGSFSDEDYFTLRYDVEARRALMHDTLGDADVFTSGTIEEVLKRAREAHQAELREELSRTKEASEVSARETSAVRKHLAEVETQHEEERRRLQAEVERSKVEPLRVLQLRSSRFAGRVVYGVMWTTFGLLLIASLLSTFSWDGPWKIAVGAGTALLAVLGVINLYFGHRIRDWADSLQEELAEWSHGRAVEKYQQQVTGGTGSGGPKTPNNDSDGTSGSPE